MHKFWDAFEISHLKPAVPQKGLYTNFDFRTFIKNIFDCIAINFATSTCGVTLKIRPM